MASILVADDDPVIQRLLTYILEQDGHDVVLAADGGEALDHLAGDETFDLLLLDLDMPDLHGLDVLKHAREDVRYTEVPVVILTASGQERDAEAAWEAGVNQFLTKPFGSRALRGVVDGLLGQGAAA